MSNNKHKTLNKIFPLFLVISSIGQSVFADSKILNSGNKEVNNVVEKKEQKVESKKQETNKKEEQKSDNKESNKNKINYKKIGVISLLSSSALGGLGYAGYYYGYPLYELYRFLQICPAISASWAKYIDKQPGGKNNWCQFYAFQGILNKEFNIKCKVADLYDIAFPNDSVRDEEKFMLDESMRKEFMDKIISKYGLQRKPYVVFKDMEQSYLKYGQPGHIDYAYQVELELIEAYKKCGSFCINTNPGFEHAVFVSDLDTTNNLTITIESGGISYVCYLDKFVRNLVYNDYNNSKKPGDCLHDAKLRIYGFEK